ncbi:hypothetical protein [uncultured Methylibium sp.]|uniref:hypothetical protein n=1 Tax=uncultured Methylibium sp. TaxID=381093 RepID=UPI0025F67645|nr:hypothetical protein [uncultured Methylibium sp.]
MGLQAGRCGGRRSEWLIGVLLCGLCAWQPARAQFTEVPGHGYREVVNPKRPVGGAMVVGVSLAGGAPGRQLNVLLSERVQGGQLRVEIDTPDGRFHGSGLFLGSAETGWVTLNLLPEDRRSQRPAEVPVDELAIAVRLVSAEGTLALRPLLASWGRPDVAGGQGTVRLHVNSRRAEVQIRGRPGTEAARCRKVTQASVVRFDAICEIDVSQMEVLDGGQRRATLLRRDGFSTESQVVELRL